MPYFHSFEFLILHELQLFEFLVFFRARKCCSTIMYFKLDIRQTIYPVTPDVSIKMTLLMGV